MHTRTIKAVVGTTNTQNSSTAAIFGVLLHHKFHHAAALKFISVENVESKF